MVPRGGLEDTKELRKMLDNYTSLEWRELDVDEKETNLNEYLRSHLHHKKLTGVESGPTATCHNPVWRRSVSPLKEQLLTDRWHLFEAPARIRAGASTRGRLLGLLIESLLPKR